MESRRRTFRACLGLPLLTVTLTGLGACKNEDKNAGGAAASASAPVAAASAAATAASSTKPALYDTGRYPIPTGPVLPILAGQGLGPIRFGANVETIERHMGKPCDYREDGACRYVSRAVEFLLKDGALSEIRIHRLERPARPAPRVFGMFNGRFPEGVQFGMYREAVAEALGKPEKTEPVENGGGANTVEVHHYPDMRLEYDRIANGNVVLGGVVLLAPTVSQPSSTQ